MADVPAEVSQLHDLIKPGLDEQKQRRRRYDHAYHVYRASYPVRQLEPWQSRARPKYAMQVIDTGLVNIVAGEPRVIVRPRGPQHERAAKGMQAVMDYYIHEDHLVEKRPLFAQQALIYGVTAAKNHWLYKTGTRQQRAFTSDGLGGYKSSAATVNVVERDGPTFEPLNIYYTGWDPNASSVDDARYVYADYWVDKEHLLANAYNPETEQGLYHNVQALLAAGDTGVEKPDATAQERFLGAQESKRKGLIHLREVWWRNNGQIWLSVVGNGRVLLRHQASPYWHGHIPIVIAQTRPDLFELQGIPETDLVDHIQQVLHTLQNMTIDNLHLTVMRGVTYREGGVTDPNSIQLKPRFKWPVVDHDDIRPFEVQPLSSDVFTERQRLLSDMQLVTGINPYVSGADLQTVDQNTATGVTALQEVASRLLRFKASQLQFSGYQRSFEMWGSMIQQFMDQKLAVRVFDGSGEMSWEEYEAQEVVGDFDFILEGSEESLSRQQARGEAIALLNAFAPLVPNLGPAALPVLKPILEKVAAAYDFPNPEALVAPIAAPQPVAPQAPQQGDQFNYNLLGPRLGMVPQRDTYLQQGGEQMDPRLQNALALIRGQ